MIDSVLAKGKAHTTEATPRDIADVLLAPGTPAPDFTLAAMPGQSLTLSDLAGQPVILAFYPADWSPVCGDQMALYNEVLPDVPRLRCRASRHLRRRRVVPCGLCPEPEPRISAARRLRAEGRGRQSLSRLSRRGRLCPAGALRHRQGRGDLLELSLARGGQSGG